MRFSRILIGGSERGRAERDSWRVRVALIAPRNIETMTKLRTASAVADPRRLALLFKIHLPASQIVIQPSSVRRYENKNKLNYIPILSITLHNYYTNGPLKCVFL